MPDFGTPEQCQEDQDESIRQDARPRVISVKVRHPSECSREELVALAVALQEELFLGCDRDGDPRWDVDKPTDAEEIQQFVLDRMNELGLYPE